MTWWEWALWCLGIHFGIGVLHAVTFAYIGGRTGAQFARSEVVLWVCFWPAPWVYGSISMAFFLFEEIYELGCRQWQKEDS